METIKNDDIQIDWESNPLMVVIESDMESRKLIKRALGESYSLRFFHHPVEVFDAHFYDSPKAILMDVTLPNVDGLKALECFRKHPLTYEIPVVAMTNDRSVKFSDKLFDMGCVGVLNRPLSLRTTKVEVKNVLKTLNRVFHSEDKSCRWTMTYGQAELVHKVKKVLRREASKPGKTLYVGWMKGESWTEEYITQAIENDKLIYLEVKPALHELFKTKAGVKQFFREIERLYPDGDKPSTFIFENPLYFLEECMEEKRDSVAHCFYRYAQGTFRKCEYFQLSHEDDVSELETFHMVNVFLGRRSK